LIRHIHFVDRDHRWLAGAAEQLGQLGVQGHQAGAAVNHLHDARGVFKGNSRLAQDFSRDEGFVVGDNAASVDDFERVPIPVAGAINAITCDSGLVGDDRAARAGEAIEQRRFPDVGAAGDYDGWKFVVHVD